jgi:SAM-dependent methyltransferase
VNPLVCPVCSTVMEETFFDLGMVPLCQRYTEAEDLTKGEMYYPLRATVCPRCRYVGLPEYVSADEIFTEYAYFSSYSDSWVDYIRKSVAELTEEFELDSASQVIEMASNDGYLLRFFIERGIPALGIEPAANVAAVANAQGIPTLPEFFNLANAKRLRDEGKSADLLLAYNCIDHVPDINDVVAGMRVLLKPNGVIQVECPYIRSMVEGNQFDTAYHDRYAYLSLFCLQYAMNQNGLRIFDAKRIPTHGGSLRIRACVSGAAYPTQPSVRALLSQEDEAGMDRPEFYRGFSRCAERVKFDILDFLVQVKREGKSVVGYGVAAKANVLLNYCGIRGDFIDYLVDRSPYKVGKFAPGSRLRILPVERIFETKPDYLMILPWNIRDEIIGQMSRIREWGGKFVVAIPELEVVA